MHSVVSLNYTYIIVDISTSDDFLLINFPETIKA